VLGSEQDDLDIRDVRDICDLGLPVLERKRNAARRLFTGDNLEDQV